MSLCGGPDHGRRQLGWQSGFDNQAVSFPDQQIADVQCDSDPVLPVQCLFAVAGVVLVLDIVVDQRGLVEAFHRDGQAAQGPGLQTRGR